MDDTPVKLPGRCTDISSNKRNGNRISLFVEGKFLGSFFRSVIQIKHIVKGDIINRKVYCQLLQEEQKYQLREQIYRWLSVRNHSSGEIRQKCFIKGYPTNEAEAIIEEFTARGLLNDLLFAKQYAEEKSDLKSWGPAKIRMALAAKGIKKQYIDSSLQTLFSENNIFDKLVKASSGIRKKLLRVQPGLKRKKKVVDFLVLKGYPLPIVLENVDTILRQVENEEI